MRDLFPSCVARAEGRYTANFSGDIYIKKILRRKMHPLFRFLYFFLNILCWHRWYQQGSRLFNYVSFAKSHVELVVRSAC